MTRMANPIASTTGRIRNFFMPRFLAGEQESGRGWLLYRGGRRGEPRRRDGSLPGGGDRLAHAGQQLLHVLPHVLLRRLVAQQVRRVVRHHYGDAAVVV